MVNISESAGKALIDSHEILQRVGVVRGMRVVNLGCGRTGHFVFSTARLVEDIGLVYAVDILKEVLDNLRSRVRAGGFDNVQLIWSDVESFGNTPIPSESTDVCFMVNVMCQFKDKKSALQEAGRLLKKGGKLVIIDWVKKLGLLGPDNNNKVSVETAMEMSREAGFEAVDNFSAGDYHYCLVLKKI